jgi:cell division protein FtsL
VAGAAAPDEAQPTAPGERRSRHLRVVEPAPRRQLSAPQRTRVLLAASSVLAIVVVFGLVYLHVVLAQRQFELDRLNQQASQAQTQYQNLRLQVAQLSSPQQIISTAEGKLGMRQPASVTYLSPSATAASSTTPASTTHSDEAPAGDADWPQIKPLLSATP